MDASPPFPTETGALDDGDRLIAWIFRHWVIGHGDERHWSLVWRELAGSHGGATASEAVAALSAVVRIICAHARRAFVYHQPCCPCLAADEFRLLAFIGACRAGDARRAAGLAEWMVLSEGVPGLIEAGARLARLIVSDHAPPPREGDDAPNRLDDAEGPCALQEAVDRA